jgi:uncharacterized protein YbaR (Trm112 family)
MHKYLIEMLECPACHGDLNWDTRLEVDDRIEQALAECQACEAAYPVKGGIGNFLAPDLERDDLWEEAQSGLAAYLDENPSVDRELMGSPVDRLSPADQFFRAMITDERGDYLAGMRIEELALAGIYSAEYRECSERQMDYLIVRLSQDPGPIVDIASGRGYLVTRIAARLGVPIVATDFSPRVLRGDRKRLEALGLYARVSLLVVDARQTPFKDSSIPTITSYLGVQNIREPGTVYAELRRILGGELCLISHFYPEQDGNSTVISQYGMENLLYKDKVRSQMADSGFRVDMANACRGTATPTPAGVLLEGAQLDGLPVTPTVLEWCVIEAR